MEAAIGGQVIDHEGARVGGGGKVNGQGQQEEAVQKLAIALVERIGKGEGVQDVESGKVGVVGVKVAHWSDTRESVGEDDLSVDHFVVLGNVVTDGATRMKVVGSVIEVSLPQKAQFIRLARLSQTSTCKKSKRVGL